MVANLAYIYIGCMVMVCFYIIRRIRLYATARAVFLCYFLILCGIGHLFCYFNSGVDEALFVRLTWVLLLSWAFVLIGIESAWLVMGRHSARAEINIRSWRQLRLTDNYRGNLAFPLLWLSVGIVMVFGSIYESQVSKLSTYFAMSGDADLVGEFRALAGGSEIYIYNLTISSLGPFVSFVLALKAYRSKSILYMVVAGSFILLVVIGKLALLNKSSFIIYIIQLVFLGVAIGDIKIRLRFVLGCVLLGGVLIYPFYLFQIGPIGGLDYVKLYFDRIFFAPYLGVHSYFGAFPDEIPHSLGRNIDIVNKLWFKEPDYTPAMVYFSQQAGNFQGSFNAMFIAEAWADFGYIGVGLVSFALGAILSCVDVYTFAKGKSIQSIAIASCLIYGIFVVSSTALQTAMLSGGILFVPLVDLIIKSFRIRRRPLTKG